MFDSDVGTGDKRFYMKLVTDSYYDVWFDADEDVENS
jgi:hypothetical protein